MEQGQTNPRSLEAAASISPVPCQGQRCLSPTLGEGEETSSATSSRRVTGLFRGVESHKVSGFGSISLPTQPQARALPQSLRWFACPLPPVTVCWAPGKEQHWGLSCGLLSVVEPGEQEGAVPVPAPLGLAEPGRAAALQG